MFDDAGRVMFTALREAARERLGAGHPCALALARAAEKPDGEAVRAAEAALRALPAADQEALMAAAHRGLRTNPQAWLSVWPGGRGPRQ